MERRSLLTSDVELLMILLLLFGRFTPTTVVPDSDPFTKEDKER